MKSSVWEAVALETMKHLNRNISWVMQNGSERERATLQPLCTGGPESHGKVVIQCVEKRAENNKRSPGRPLNKEKTKEDTPPR